MGKGESPLTSNQPELVIALEEELTDEEEEEKKELEASGDDSERLKHLKHK
jgi:hypothetical protein